MPTGALRFLEAPFGLVLKTIFQQKKPLALKRAHELLSKSAPTSLNEFLHFLQNA
ncbi:unknown [Coraliomargarita sp. CAG:312]|nr:unknown [Coraliomargarita sp. CAG:312]